MNGLVRLGIVLAIATGCGRHLNPDYCATHEDTDCPADASVPCDPAAATGPASCAPRVCEPTQHVCVDCTLDDNPCPATAPTCGSDFHCHSQCDSCPSMVCKTDGSCEDPLNVIYVTPNGAGMDCSITAKCTLQQGLLEAVAPRLTIKLDAGVYMPPGGAGLKVMAVGARLIGYGAELTGGGPVLDVLAGADISLEGLQISGGMGGTGFGLRCAANAKVRASHMLLISNIAMNTYAIESACDLTLDASTITANFKSLNITGGVVSITNNLFVKNGRPDIVGAPIVITGNAMGGFRFNTVANNTTKMAKGPAGVTCTPVDPTVLNTDGNIITDNNEQANYTDQTSGTCTWSLSYTSPGTGTNQLAWNPLSYHLTGASPALVRDVEGVSCQGMTDIDGDMRPINGGLHLACDYGADEYKP